MKRAVLLLALLAACKKDKEMSGVGIWNVHKTHLKDATGRCTPDTGGGMYCFGQKPMGIKGMTVDIDLYFGGSDPDATLTEIQLKAGACDDQDFLSWMTTNFGRPTEDRGARKMWKNDFLWAVADLPLADDPMQCLVRLIPVEQQARFDKVWPAK